MDSDLVTQLRLEGGWWKNLHLITLWVSCVILNICNQKWFTSVLTCCTKAFQYFKRDSSFSHRHQINCFRVIFWTQKLKVYTHMYYINSKKLQSSWSSVLQSDFLQLAFVKINCSCHVTLKVEMSKGQLVLSDCCSYHWLRQRHWNTFFKAQLFFWKKDGLWYNLHSLLAQHIYIQ